MYIITVFHNQETYRDSSISSILSDSVMNEKYVWSGTSNRFSETTSFLHAKVFKNEGGAIKFVDGFNKNKNYDRYGLIKNKHLSYRKLTRQEWDLIINNELNHLKSKYERACDKIEMKRRMFK